MFHSSNRTAIETEIRALLKPGELTEILTDASHGLRKLRRVDSQLKYSALAIHDDPETSIQLSYDAARRAVAAILEAFGLRMHERAGSHSSYVKVVSIDVFNQDIWRDLEWMKKLRNQSQYADSTMPELTVDQAQESFLAAKAMVSDAKRLLNLFVNAESRT